MSTSQRMAQLGRKGGLRGGVARARLLPKARRTEIARQGAEARWNQALIIDRAPRSEDELRAFVAHYGARVSKGVARASLDAVVLRALESSRHDPSLARMLPVFLWRVRSRLNLAALVAKAHQRGLAASLGYFLELTSRLGSWRGFAAALTQLRVHAQPDHPFCFFHGTEKHPFEAFLAEQRTPANARRWGLITGMPTDSFATYFKKVSAL